MEWCEFVKSHHLFSKAFFLSKVLQTFLRLANSKKTTLIQTKKIFRKSWNNTWFNFQTKNNESFKTKQCTNKKWKYTFLFPNKMFFFFLKRKQKYCKSFPKFFFLHRYIHSNYPCTIENKKKKILKFSFFQIKLLTLLTNSFQQERIVVGWINVISKIGRPRTFFFIIIFWTQRMLVFSLKLIFFNNIFNCLTNLNSKNIYCMVLCVGLKFS